MACVVLAVKREFWLARGQAILDVSSHETGDINDPTAAGDDGVHMLHLYTEASFRLYRSRNSGSYWRFGCRKQQLGRFVNSRVGRIASWTVRPTKYGYQRDQSSFYHSSEPLGCTYGLNPA